MLLKWLPWNFLLKRVARSYGFIDPAMVIARIRSFSQPSEVQEPLELVKAGVIFQARGLINTRVIQFNLDWIWPYWVEKQYNPNDRSFIPRAFSFSHINLTQRNWTALGLPDLPLYPLVDPRGLITPLYDGWSIDFWIVTEEGPDLFPSKLASVKQTQRIEPELVVDTEASFENSHIKTSAWMEVINSIPLLKIQCMAKSEKKGWLVLSIRPYNPEGISFIETIKYDKGKNTFLVNKETPVVLDMAPIMINYGSFEEGDVYYRLNGREERDGISCSAGMANAAALFRLEPNNETTIQSFVPLARELKKNFSNPKSTSRRWHEVLLSTARLKIPDKTVNRLYNAAAGTLTLLSAQDIYPGPYNYRRFWFRDACLMINALMSFGLIERSRRLIDSFPERQNVTGFFQSQEGEWDSNGQVLWIMGRYLELTGEKAPEKWLKAVLKATGWLERKIIKNASGTRHQGLLPPGFSAEHFGPNDYYYWDDMWALAGMKAAERMFGSAGMEEEQKQTAAMREEFESSLWTSLVQATRDTPGKAFPAAPYRRMDAGAIGSMVADYPLRLLPANNARIMATCEWLMENCFYKDGFFQDMVHSGVNCYLTLGLAQTLLRAGDTRYRKLIRYMADLASSTGHWPEAVHPFSGGGCMGDGQHGWAAAEWIMMIRNIFIREEEKSLIIGSGIFPEWLEKRGELYFGPAPTTWGNLEVIIENTGEEIFVTLSGTVKGKPDVIEAAIPGTRKSIIPETNQRYRIER